MSVLKIIIRRLIGLSIIVNDNRFNGLQFFKVQFGKFDYCCCVDFKFNHITDTIYKILWVTNSVQYCRF